MKPIVYIDGQEGTTGLQIHDRLKKRDDITLIAIDPDRRKDTEERKKMLNAADLVFLCLPDAAAVEAVSLIENPCTRVIDASTAHRTAPGWAYGFPELSQAHREAIAGGMRVANPGCHASGFIAVVYPLIALGLLPRDALLTCFSLTGYSGGGKKMIAEYEGPDRGIALSSPGIYGIGQGHKHLPEMQAQCGLTTAPVFCPIVDDYYKGMATTVSFHASQFAVPVTADTLRRHLRDYYRAPGTGVVCMMGDSPIDISAPASSAKLYGNALAGQDHMELAVAGNDERITITALFDNLGKGASGAAVQNMNLMLGFWEYEGLQIPPQTAVFLPF